MKSERLLFRKFIGEDFEDYSKLVQDEQVMKMITGRASSDQEAREKFAQVLAITRHSEVGYYHISTITDGNFIGLGKLVLTGSGVAEIGYSLLPAGWGKGYGSEIATFLVEHAKCITYLNTLTAIIDPDNMASKRILQKLHFKLDRACEMNSLPAEIYKLYIK
jgi:RimJ/RimL family protein N-acetyltransferase